MPQATIGCDDQQSGTRVQITDERDDGRIAVPVGAHHLDPTRNARRGRGPGGALHDGDEPVDRHDVAARPGHLCSWEHGEPIEQSTRRGGPVPPPPVRTGAEHIGHIDHDDHPARIERSPTAASVEQPVRDPRSPTQVKPFPARLPAPQPAAGYLLRAIDDRCR